MTDKIDQALTELETTLQPFMPRKQAQILIQNLTNSEDADAFADIVLTLAERVKAMPQPYETDGQGKTATACTILSVLMMPTSSKKTRPKNKFRLSAGQVSDMGSSAVTSRLTNFWIWRNWICISLLAPSPKRLRRTDRCCTGT